MNKQPTLDVERVVTLALHETAQSVAGHHAVARDKQWYRIGSAGTGHGARAGSHAARQFGIGNGLPGGDA